MSKSDSIVLFGRGSIASANSASGNYTITISYTSTLKGDIVDVGTEGFEVKITYTN
jgi:hypothetical protein